MSSPASISSGAIRAAFVCALAGNLGGCYTLDAGGGKSASPATPPAPAKFNSFNGTVTSKGVFTKAITNDFNGTSTLTVETKDKPTDVVAYVKTADTLSKTQGVDFKANGDVAYFKAYNSTIESNGAAVRGNAVNSPDTWATYTNTPGARLDASLGAASLENSYIGVATFGRRATGTTGTMYSYATAFFGGASTNDMPKTGTAEYNGAFEGFQQQTRNGSPLDRSDISGKANLTANFAANTVTGRIDDINNHSVGPVKSPVDYSIAFEGKITDATFAGTSWLTQKGGNSPLSGHTTNAGSLQGGFFGAGAAETAGAIGVTASDGVGKVLVTGAFGAAKKK